MREDSKKEVRKLDTGAVKSFLDEHGASIHPSSNSFILKCPKCEKNKLAIRKSDGFSKCYKCGRDFAVGYADYVLSAAFHVPKEELANKFYGVRLDTFEEEVDSNWVDWYGSDEIFEDVEQTPEEMLPDLDFRELDSKLGEEGLEYLNGRGISLELAKEYGIKYHPPTQRVVFPAYVDGILRGWQGRYVKNTKKTLSNGDTINLPKIMTYGSIGGKILLFQDNLLYSTHGIITEGPVDAIKCHLCGGNTATMGKNVTSTQIDIYIKKYKMNKLYIGLDNDAELDVERIVRDLTWFEGLELYRLLPPKGCKDLGEGGLEENLEQFNKAERINHGTFFVSFG